MQLAARALDGGGAERRRTNAGWDAHEKSPGEASLQSGYGAGELRRGDEETVGGGADVGGLGDLGRSNEFAADFEPA